MQSKLLVNVMENGSPCITVIQPNLRPDQEFILAERVLQMFFEKSGSDGKFCRIISDNQNFPDSTVRQIIPMNALDVMQNILDIYGQMFHPEGPKLMGSEYTDRKDFEQAVFKVCSMIESVSGERSTVFKEKVDAQDLSNVSFNGEKQCPKCLTDSVG